MEVMPFSGFGTISVFAAKYRCKALTGDVGIKTREPARRTCEAFVIQIFKGAVGSSHVHIFVSAPPNIAPGEIMRGMKGRSQTKPFESFADLRR